MFVYTFGVCTRSLCERAGRFDCSYVFRGSSPTPPAPPLLTKPPDGRRNALTAIFEYRGLSYSATNVLSLVALW